jgi:hypothetical protein
MGTTAVDRKNRIGRRERRAILKSAQRRGDGVVAVDKCQLEPLRPNTFSGCSKKGSLVAIANVIFGQAFLGSIGLNRASSRKPSSVDAR